MNPMSATSPASPAPAPTRPRLTPPRPRLLADIGVAALAFIAFGLPSILLAPQPWHVEFFLFGIAGGIFQRKLGKSKKGEVGSRIALDVIKRFRKPVRDALKKSHRFEPPADIYELAEYAEQMAAAEREAEAWCAAHPGGQ